LDVTLKETQENHSDITQVSNDLESNVVVNSDAIVHGDLESSFDTGIKSPIEKEICTDTEISVNDYPRVSFDVTSNQSFNHVSTNNKQTRDTTNQGEEEMSEVDTNMLSGQHADIRREQAVGFGDTRYNISERAGDIRREIAGAACDINRNISHEGQENIIATKDSRHDIINEIDRQADRLDNQAASFYIAGQTNANISARDLATLTALTEANATAMRQEIALNVEKTSAAAALAAEKIAAASALSGEKVATAVALGQAQLARDIFYDGQKTRDLMNDMKYHDLNRALVERNTELVNCDHERDRYRDRYWDSRQDQFGSQFAALQNQLQSLNQNFNSQLAETRQGMVNFGTMAGNAGQQSSTSNNVR
jgi:hypothetical protein